MEESIPQKLISQDTFIIRKKIHGVVHLLELLQGGKNLLRAPSLLCKRHVKLQL